MPTTIVATNTEELLAVIDVIHDCWFEKENIHFDPKSETLTIPFTKPNPSDRKVLSRTGPLKKVEIPYYESRLQIAHVSDWLLEDTERVGRYDFNELVWDEGSHRLTVSTGIPLTLAADVSRLEVSVETTKAVARVKSKYTLLS